MKLNQGSKPNSIAAKDLFGKKYSHNLLSQKHNVLM
jgi:hypothetical protein